MLYEVSLSPTDLTAGSWPPINRYVFKLPKRVQDLHGHQCLKQTYFHLYQFRFYLHFLIIGYYPETLKKIEYKYGNLCIS